MIIFLSDWSTNVSTTGYHEAVYDERTSLVIDVNFPGPIPYSEWIGPAFVVSDWRANWYGSFAETQAADRGRIRKVPVNIDCEDINFR